MVTAKKGVRHHRGPRGEHWLGRALNNLPTLRFLDQPCLALFGREGLPAELRAKALGALCNIDSAVDWFEGGRDQQERTGENRR